MFFFLSPLQCHSQQENEGAGGLGTPVCQQQPAAPQGTARGIEQLRGGLPGHAVSVLRRQLFVNQLLWL